MSAKRTAKKVMSVARTQVRVPGVRSISVHYEGRREEVVIKPPDLSAHGMFISTSRSFPEGAVLNLRFQLQLTGALVETRGEVRYCLPGVGVGVEFIGVSPEARQQITREIQLEDKVRPRTAEPSKSL